MPLFQGLSAFPITPADDDGVVDIDALQRLLARLIEAKVDSIGLLGSTGSYPYLRRCERRRAIEASVEVTRGVVPLLVGVGALRTDEAVRLAIDAQVAGADGLLLAPVSYIPLLADEVFEHFAVVAAATDLPLCVYNNPGTTHFTIESDLLIRLSRLTNVVAAKNPSPDPDDAAAVHRKLSDGVAEGFALGYSIDWHATEALIAGGSAWYSVAAGLFPVPCLRIMRAVQGGEYDRARQLNADLQPLWDLFREYSSYRVVHTAAGVLGFTRASPPRPVLPVSEATRICITSTLERLGLVC